MTLRLSGTLHTEIRKDGERAYPAECCGVLVGRVGEIKEVQRLVPMPNRRTDDPHRFLISSEDLHRVQLELDQAGDEVLGFYHSHPDHPAVPSAFDVEHAWPWYSYVIVQVERGHATELTSWELEQNRSAMRPEALEVFSEV